MEFHLMEEVGEERLLELENEGLWSKGKKLQVEEAFFGDTTAYRSRLSHVNQLLILLLHNGVSPEWRRWARSVCLELEMKVVEQGKKLQVEEASLVIQQLQE
uniref:Ovule protein n=1 Tax=Meloidogyne hapla TaxID=6305 RepID=A0A1I8B1D6_MELHA